MTPPKYVSRAPNTSTVIGLPSRALLCEPVPLNVRPMVSNRNAAYLAGGGIKAHAPTATYVSRNLTPDKETGLARRSDDEVKRVLRSGLFPDGHVVAGTSMPWPAFSNWSEEDLHAVLVYLRHVPAIRHQTPEPVFTNGIATPGAIEEDHAWRDYGTSEAKPLR